MKKLVFVLFCLFTIPVAASHIVGGEFELIHLPGLNFEYQVNLILYFDENNGNPSAKDPTISATIFRKRDNAFMRTVFFSDYVQTPVYYTQPGCSKGEIVTSKLTYTTNVTLASDTYSDPAGYYIVWERCCRNYTITNIISQDPNSGGIGAGQTFYLEFPPVMKDGQPFINSSPRLFPPLNDYACPLKLYYVDFAGVDDDGDSLAYSLVTPLSTHSASPLPPPAPAPFPLVQWRSPFSDTNIINGSPDLKISTDGFLTARPPRLGLGLYVFAVKCEEFRDGIKIGEVRRDFQMLVVDKCPESDAPQILGKKMSDVGFLYDGTMSVTFNSAVNNTDRCIQVQVSDADASKATENFEEKITIKAIPLNFKKNVSGILPAITNATLTNGSTKIFDICFDECPFIEGPFQVGIVAYDDACSLPLSDTLKVTVNITPPLNHNARFVTPDVNAILLEGSAIKHWPITAVDDDGDMMSLRFVFEKGLDVSKVGMSYNVETQKNDTLKAEFAWDPNCEIHDFTDKTQFFVKVFVEDADQCGFNHPDTMIFELKLDDHNADPLISANLPTKTNHRRDSITHIMYQTPAIAFIVTGNDADNDNITLEMTGKNFKLSDYPIVFNSATGYGNVSSPFNWPIDCNAVDLTKKDEFDFQFVVVDKLNKCHIYKADTLDVHVKIEPPINTKPTLTINSLDPNVPLKGNSVSVELGQQVTLGLYGNDVDLPRDHLKIELTDAKGNVAPKGYEFQPGDGLGTAQAQFVWHPDCSIFEGGIYKNDYTFTFRVTDDRCLSMKGDTAVVNIDISDVDADSVDFIPPNFITPNGDGRNDFFAMVKENEVSKELESILPKDNCTGRFINIRIYNRWGKEVFLSTSRDFRWFAEDAVVGVYFYYLNYSNKEYKGTVSVRL